MSTLEDDRTSTVDGAAAFERHRGLEDHVAHEVTMADVEHDGPARPIRLCLAVRPVKDRPGYVQGCGLAEHGDKIRHEPYPYHWPLAVEEPF